MKQTIEIDIPKGYRAKYNQETQKIELVKVDNRSRSWEEFCENNPDIEGEYYLAADGSFSRVTNSTYGRDVKNDKNLLSTKEDAEGLLALIQLTRLHDEWIGDWKANWKSSESKYVILHTTNEYVVRDGVYYHRLLVFPTVEMAKEFMECFKDLLKKAKKFI